MKTSALLRPFLGTAATCLLASAAIALGTPAAAADPITDLLCNSGSTQFCPPARPNNPPPRSEPTLYYKNCDEVRRAGRAPLYRGQPGYASHLDRDNDGIACE
ncbi:excalibur calcium-binding domain-containing protein [Nocardia sp. NPDC057440]|uniref:excalibur calcium-binding domain-containing protein n=1 Tax=Nocardia sp. NPDC057440 TaxID=3346134 RepID=UPI003670928E